MQKHKPLLPNIRFPEFKKEWEQKPLNNFLTQSKAKNKKLEFDKSEVLSVAAEAGVVNQIEYHGRSYAGTSVEPYGILRKGEMVYTKSPLKIYPYGIIKLNNHADGIVSTLYANYRVAKNASGEFLDYYFYHPHRINRYLKPLVNIGAKNDMKINNDYAISDPITAPEFEEQKKIAFFLGAVDQKIRQLQKKKDFLEQYKTGCMQKLFSQKLRFTDKNGKEFPAWEEKSLNSLFVINPKKKELPQEFIYIDLESVKKGRLILENRISNIDAPSRAQRLLLKEDILFQTVRPYQRNNFYFDLEGSYVASTGYAQLRAKKGHFPKFIYYLLHTDNVVREVLAWSTGSNYPAINSDDLKRIDALCPHYDEQKKIADFLSAIDNKIALVIEELSKTKTFKKGLLQQMFV